jgi:hypothetical protein
MRTTDHARKAAQRERERAAGMRYVHIQITPEQVAALDALAAELQVSRKDAAAALLSDALAARAPTRRP